MNGHIEFSEFENYAIGDYFKKAGISARLAGSNLSKKLSDRRADAAGNKSGKLLTAAYTNKRIAEDTARKYNTPVDPLAKIDGSLIKKHNAAVDKRTRLLKANSRVEGTLIAASNASKKSQASIDRLKRSLAETNNKISKDNAAVKQGLSDIKNNTLSGIRGRVSAAFMNSAGNRNLKAGVAQGSKATAAEARATTARNTANEYGKKAREAYNTAKQANAATAGASSKNIAKYRKEADTARQSMGSLQGMAAKFGNKANAYSGKAGTASAKAVGFYDKGSTQKDKAKATMKAANARLGTAKAGFKALGHLFK